MRAHVVGWGKYTPHRILTNDDLAQMVDTSDEWIVTRTGIRQRRIAEEGETTAAMALQAARQALEGSGIRPGQIDLIIVATATPDYLFPSTACLVQDALGATHAGAFDLAAGCTGFVYALAVAAAMIEAGAIRTALVIGSETLSRITDWTDRNTCVLFGDGAGAVVLQARPEEGGVLATVLGADGSGADLLMLPAGGSKQPASHHTVSERLHFIKMQGRDVFRFAVRVIPSATRQVLEKAGLSLEDIRLFIPHQANGRIIESAVRDLKLPPEKVYNNLDRYGNTSAASIPIALCEAVEEGRLAPGDLVVCVGFGAGLTWGAAAIRWTHPRPLPVSRWQQVWRRFGYFWVAVASRLRRLWWRIRALFWKNRR